VEKMRVFEKTFGIDQLNSMVKKLEHQMKVKMNKNNRTYRIKEELNVAAPLSLASQI
jgi:hypothetical protein